MSTKFGILFLVLAWHSFMYMVIGLAAMSGAATFWGGIGLIVFGVATKVCLKKSFGG